MVAISSMQLKEQLTLRIDREFQKQLDEVITNMRKIAKGFKIEQIKEKSPFKNVLAVAVEPTASLEVVKNFIRYQVGRKESSRIWKLEKIEDGKKVFFAQRVVEGIDELSTSVQKVFDAVFDTIKQDSEEKDDLKQDGVERERLESLKAYLQKNERELKQSLHLKLAQLYLGYLSREHIALLGYQIQKGNVIS